ncbi:MAG: hypothetical protein K9H12_03740 [Bacteroidales bacterium]|nr:hypothetical protein [Bacteroidales bacterium]
MKSIIQRKYYSNGNLLISGEYFVLLGAKALAIPLNYGQDLQITAFENNDQNIDWQASEAGKVWLNVNFNSEKLQIISTNVKEKANWLQNVFSSLLKLKPGLLQKHYSYKFKSNIEFNTNWGWGSSSSILLNLARWAEVDPFELNKLVSSGSGYDIAASGSSSPIIYQLVNEVQQISPIDFNPVFKQNIWFIYLGKKQNTADSIINSKTALMKNVNLVHEISHLTEKMAVESKIDEFMKSMSEHENIISKTLQIPKIKELYFKDFEGEIKSLGAWGGDFAMIVSHVSERAIKQYFKNKKLETIFGFSEIVRNQSGTESN